MANEDIIAALRNGVERGESLQDSIQILINSGYNEKDIQEASKFVSGVGTISMPEPKPGEQLVMPEKKGFFTKLFKKKIKHGQKVKETAELSQNSQQQFANQIKLAVTTEPVTPQPTTEPVTPQPTTEPVTPQSQTPNPITMSELTPTQPIQATQQIQPKKIKKIKKPIKLHAKEIILFVILLILLGLLAATILLKDKIIAFLV